MNKNTNRIIFTLLALTLLAQSYPAGKEIRPPGTKGGPMVYVPAGEFWMGCNEQVDNQCEADEKPYHKVDLDAFYIDKFKVTNGEYQKCVQAGKCREPEYNDSSSEHRLGGPENIYQGFVGGRQPVVGVDWNDAKSYCEWAGKRLPTEAEWEKAARGTDGRKYPWGNQAPSCKVANFSACGVKPVKVGSKPGGASPYGALDLAGNAWEWVADWYDDKYYGNSPSQNPKGSSSGATRVWRGGCWCSWASDIRASNRLWNAPMYRNGILSFRCARDGS